MRWKHLVQSFYETQLARSFWPVIISDDPLAIYRLYVTQEPQYNNWWLIIEYENKSNREILYFHNRDWIELLVYKKDRWLAPTIEKAITHPESSSVRMHDVADFFNELSKSISSFWLIEQWYNEDNSLYVKVEWGRIDLMSWGILEVDGEIFELDPSTTYNIYVDVSDSTIKFKTDPIDWKDIILWEVVTGVDTITSITDKRADMSYSLFSEDFFQLVDWELLIKDWSITETKLASNSVISSKIANNAVTTEKIVNNAVTTEKIANDGVTNAKIQPNPELRGTVGMDNVWSNPSLPEAGKIKLFVKSLLWIPTVHSVDSDGNILVLWINPIIAPWSSVMIWPVNWTDTSATTVFNDVSIVAATSQVTSFHIGTGTMIGLVVEANITTNGSVTFTSYNNEGELQNESDVTFYFSIIY